MFLGSNLWPNSKGSEAQRRQQQVMLAYYAVIFTGKTLAWGLNALYTRSNRKAMERDLERLVNSHGVILEDELLED